MLGIQPCIAIKGRVVSTEGNGLAGVNVTGDFCSHREHQETKRPFFAVTDKDGVYVFTNISQPSVWITGGWLNGGNPMAAQANFYFEVQSEKGGRQMIPLVSENLLKQARRLHEAMNAVEKQLTDREKPPFSEKPKEAAPKSIGDVIFMPDITVKIVNAAKDEIPEKK